MIDGLLLHDITRGQLKAMAANPPHAILLVGPAGSGKKTLSMALAAEIADVPYRKISSHPSLIEITRPADKTEIPIESIRGLIKALSLRTTEKTRVVLIKEAASLSEEAQNSLLKLIEEPPARTVFILSVPALSDILPTVASRAQKLNILPVSHSQALEYFGKNYDDAQVTSAWMLGRAGAGSIAAILEKSGDHQLKIGVDSAKKFLNMTRYERLVFLDGIASGREDLQAFLDALDRVLAALAKSDIKKGAGSRTKKILAARRHINLSMESLARNVSPRLVVVDLALNLSV
ncbi:MAG TPA: AAA family ATPase [Candidatus Saccharimonadales bacterium]|nr:AAA family ATPase [Candidatus Saccharimonadales bacterium]